MKYKISKYHAVIPSSALCVTNFHPLRVHLIDRRETQ